MTVADLTKVDPKSGKAPIENAQATMSPESFAKVEEAVAAGDETAKVDVLLTQKNKLHESRDMLFGEPGHRYNAFDQFSMVLALVLGTAGLPHILNRYYTNPSGSAARRSTFWVLVFIGTFYIMAPIAGLAGRGFIKAAAAAGSAPANAALVDGILVKSDALMPTIAQILGRQWLMGIVAAGAFAAMFSTIGGLLIAASSAIGHDVYEKYINPNASEAKRVAVGKISVVGFSLLAFVLGWAIPYFGLDKAYPALIAMMVTWAFSVGASAFVPMLLTGIWWKGTTEKGAISGMLVGLIGAIGIIFMNIFQQLKVPAFAADQGFIGFIASLTFPVLFTFPIALGDDRHRQQARREDPREHRLDLDADPRYRSRALREGPGSRQGRHHVRWRQQVTIGSTGAGNGTWSEGGPSATHPGRGSVFGVLAVWRAVSSEEGARTRRWGASRASASTRRGGRARAVPRPPCALRASAVSMASAASASMGATAKTSTSSASGDPAAAATSHTATILPFTSTVGAALWAASKT